MGQHRRARHSGRSAWRRSIRSGALVAAAAVVVSGLGGAPRAEGQVASPSTEAPGEGTEWTEPGDRVPSGRPSPFDLPRGARELGVVAGGALSVAAIGALNDEEVAGRQIALLSLRYSRVLLRRDSFALQYFADLTPLAVETADLVAAEDGSEGLERKTAYGAGIVPIGARLVFRPDARLKPYLGASGGILLLSQEVPLPGARKYAFSGDVEAGVQYWIGERHSLNGGVRFHHISNAETGDTNPGLNAFVFFVGFSVYR